MIHDIAIVGAGISGLALGRELGSLGIAPVIIERARGVGGRCATRRIEDQPVDHGVAFLHGRDERFVAELASIHAATGVPGWPRVRAGAGLPCQPEAFDRDERRLALREGVSRFAKHLARGLDVRLQTTITALRRTSGPEHPEGAVWELTVGSGDRLRATAIALTMPPPSALGLLRSQSPGSATIAQLVPLLEMVRMLPCLTVIARYPEGTPPPDWDASYPDQGGPILMIAHDSSKRAGASRLILVIQARPRFSGAHQGEPPDAWARTLLDHAASIHGAWVARPDLVQPHLWRHARVEPTTELAAPIAVRLEDGGILGVCGDGFSASGGLEGAYRSGVALAARMSPMLRK